MTDEEILKKWFVEYYAGPEEASGMILEEEPQWRIDDWKALIAMGRAQGAAEQREVDANLVSTAWRVAPSIWCCPACGMPDAESLAKMIRTQDQSVEPVKTIEVKS
jgi:rubredoxin